MKRSRNMLGLVRLGVLIGLAGLTSVWCAQIATVEQAYAHFRSGDSMLPRDMSKRDLEAFDVMRGRRREAREFFIGLLSKNGGGDRGSETICTRVFDRTETLEIARIVMPTYSAEDIYIPFAGFLGFFGEKQDMELIKAWFGRDPNSVRSAEQAITMATSDNRYAHAALLEWRAQIPGKWQESFELKTFFAQRASDVPPKENPSASPARRASKSSETVIARAAEKASEPSSPIAEGSWWRFGGIGIAVLLALLLLIRRIFK